MSNTDQLAQQQNTYYIHAEMFANSYAKAALIDLPVTIFLTFITTFPKKGLDEVFHASTVNGAYALAASTVGYMTRYEIKYFLQDFNFNDFTDYSIKGLAGLVGGALKYGIAKGFTPINVFLGAFNNAGYEIGSDIMGYNLLSDFAGATFIESSENVIAERLSPTVLDNTATFLDKLYTHPFAMGGIVGLSLFASVHGLFLNYGGEVKTATHTYLEKLGYYNITLDTTTTEPLDIDSLFCIDENGDTQPCEL